MTTECLLWPGPCKHRKEPDTQGPCSPDAYTDQKPDTRHTATGRGWSGGHRWEEAALERRARDPDKQAEKGGLFVKGSE